MADRAARLAAHELERIRVLLLRHHAAAGAERVGQLEEPVLVAAEDDQVLGQPAEMHHRQRARVQERRGEVAIRRGVDAVGDDAREAEVARERVDVDRVARAGDRAGAERQRVGFGARRREALVVAAERRGVRQKEMRDEHRLRRPEVRVRRHQRVARRRGLRRRAPRRRAASACCSAGMRRRRYSRRSSDTCSLRDRPVCSRRPASPSRSTSSRSTKLCTSSSGPATKAGFATALLEDLGQRGVDRRASSAREHAGLRERPRPRQAARHVVFEQAAIEAERGAEFEGGGIGRRVEPAGPESSHQLQSAVVSRQSTASIASSAAGDRRWHAAADCAFERRSRPAGRRS